ncbi:low temperature requirement protein A [Rugosimonospora acidiphila]|uniref:Low temperature requirement protein A n=1 Tax=Rugosimonospora acidiphila TaxID=556531 RepID=A0ABP9S225_9ACTN
MTGNQAEQVLRGRERAPSASYMELFFDLAFIFSLTELTRVLLVDLSVGGALRFLLLLAAMWWVWTVTAWSTDWFDPEQRFVRALLAWVMIGILLQAVALTRAFGPEALVFAGTYVAIHLGRGAGLAYRLRGHPAARRSARVAIWFVITGVAWIVGALVPAARHPLWAVAIVIDGTIGLFGYPVPGLGRSTQAELRVSGEHFSERFGQFVIVAIGELILMSSLAIREVGFHPASTVAFVLSFINALLFTQIYHLPLGRGLPAFMEESRTPGRTALISGYLHYLLLAGILTASAGNVLVIEHAGGPGQIRYSLVVVVGAAVFLAWRIVLLFAAAGRAAWWRALALVAVLAVVPATARLHPVTATAGVDLVLFATGLAEGARARRDLGKPAWRSAS